MTALRTLLAFLRNTWRGLTSMRTALILLFLLALAALPGAVLPQYSLNPDAVADYLEQHSTLGPLLDRLGFFAVYASPWFAAIYLLLFTSLVGCLVPRLAEYLRQLTVKPVLTPRNLARMPHHQESTVDSEVDEVMAAARRRLRGWRSTERAEENGARTISAERGFLREAGNLVFHFALLGVLLSVAFGKLFGYEGSVIVMANGDKFCNYGPAAYDKFRPGLLVDGTRLGSFCFRLDNFNADFLPTGQADGFQAKLSYQDGAALATDQWKQAELQVNEPLRLTDERIYLIGHGYAPQFTVTFPGGKQRTGLIQWKPDNPMTFLSSGATKFDPPDVTDPDQRRRGQLAITGLLAPTATFDGTLLGSKFPELNDPAVALDIYRGDLGNESGRSQSIFSIDPTMVESGKLKKVLRTNLRLGEQTTLDDGTVVKFDGVKEWASLQVSYDPAQLWVLIAGVAVITGIGLSLTVKRRRIWVRATPAGPEAGGGRTVIEIGGLARTDQAGYGEEFTRIAAELLAHGRPGAGRTPD